MSVNPAFRQHLEGDFDRFFNFPVQINDVKPVHGGDINHCFILKTTAGNFFLKANDALYGLSFFEKEAEGLLALAATGTLKVPQPLFYGSFQEQIYLVMEYLEYGPESQIFWSSFGAGLANLHKNTNSQFGWKDSNYIGKVVQLNRLHDQWADFYCEERILNNVKNAFDSLLLDITDIKNAEKMCSRLHDLIPAEPPALLHGDLWNGNTMALQNGHAAIFDPSVYYGHRETDLAMTKLFGGFEESFYASYNQHFPLAPGWQNRLPLFQLYPLLIHLRLFGGHCRHSVTNILKKFS